jgi:hypothetical protein
VPYIARGELASLAHDSIAVNYGGADDAEHARYMPGSVAAADDRDRGDSNRNMKHDYANRQEVMGGPCGSALA